MAQHALTQESAERSRACSHCPLFPALSSSSVRKQYKCSVPSALRVSLSVSRDFDSGFWYFLKVHSLVLKHQSLV